MSGKPTTVKESFHYRDYVHFDFDEIGIDAEHGCAERLEEHPKMPFENSIPEEGCPLAVMLGRAYLKTELDAGDTAARLPGFGPALLGRQLGQNDQ